MILFFDSQEQRTINMKRFIAILLIVTMAFSLCACAQEKKEISNVNSEVVEAIIISAHSPYRGTRNITVAYEDVSSTWYGREYYDKFASDVGFYVRCILITYSYKDGSIEKELIYNEEIYNGGELK